MFMHQSRKLASHPVTVITRLFFPLPASRSHAVLSVSASRTASEELLDRGDSLALLPYTYSCFQIGNNLPTHPNPPQIVSQSFWIPFSSMFLVCVSQLRCLRYNQVSSSLTLVRIQGGATTSRAVCTQYMHQFPLSKFVGDELRRCTADQEPSLHHSCSPDPESYNATK